MDDPPDWLSRMAQKLWAAPGNARPSRNALMRVISSESAPSLIDGQTAYVHPDVRARDEVFRGSFLPFREMSTGEHEWAAPSVVNDVWNAAKAVAADTDFTRGGAYMPLSQRPEAEREAVLGHLMAGAGAGITGGLTRSALSHPLPAGTRELGIFGGRRGAEALAAKGEHRPMLMLQALDDMEKAGASREDIWKATSEIGKGSPYAGAHRGVDKMPRFEISDHGSMIPFPAQNEISKHGSAAGSAMAAALKYPELYEAYPALRRTTWSIWDGPEGGRYSPSIYGGYATGNVRASGPTTLDRHSVLLHEMQHGVQPEEGFAVGTHPANMERYVQHAAPGISADKAAEAAYEAYHRHAGEVEARAVQARKDLTPYQRAARPPWLDYDVPESQQIVRFK